MTTSTSTGGAAKLQRAINQLYNVERLIGSLPRQYSLDKAREIANETKRLRERIIRELAKGK